MATSTGTLNSPSSHHEILVAEDLALPSLPSKRTAIYKIVQSVKDDLTTVEGKLAEIPTGISEKEAKLENLAKTLQLLQSTLGDAVEYLPAYEQRLLQSRITSASRLLAEKQSERNASQGFSFRRAPKPSKAKTPLDGLDVPDSSVISPINSLVGCSGISQNTIGLSDTQNVKKIFDRSALKNKDVLLSSLSGCKIFLQGCASTLNLKNLTDCLIISGPIRTSVFLSGCRNCTLVVACQQLRIHDSENLRCYVHLTSGGIIEDTANCAFAPYAITYPDLDCDFVDANLRRDGNDHWQQIEDFNYVVSNKRSPNWTVIPESARETFSDLTF